MALPSNLAAPQSILASIAPLRARAGAFLAQPAVRRSVPAVAVVAVAAVALVGWLALQGPTLRPLFPGLPDAEKSRVIEVLTAAGIDASLQSTTGDVQVPEADFYRARMALAAEGLPESLPAAEDVLGKLQLGTSRSVEGMRLRQAQEADLARSIASIAGVAGARVHLALPERSAFLRDTQPPAASVVVTMKSGNVLSPGQVEAVVNLVASSVPGLARENVSVIDHRGQLLSQGGTDPAAALTSRQMQERAELEQMYRGRIESLLMPLTGPDALSVQVTLDMDFTTTEVQAQTVIPDSATVLSEESQSSETTSPPARGIPGRVSNTPPTTAATVTAAPPTQAETATEGPQTRSESAKRSYDVGRRIETIRPGAPRVLRVSAAVLVATPAEGGDEAAATARLADMERLVRGAIGFDEARGDVVTVLAQPFAPTPEMPALTTEAGASRLLWIAGGGAGVVLLAAGGWVALRRRAPAFPAPRAAEPPVQAALAPDLALPGPAEDSPEQIAREERRQQLARAALSSGSRDEKFAILRQIAEDDPARIAAALRKMMKDEIDRVL